MIPSFLYTESKRFDDETSTIYFNLAKTEKDAQEVFGPTHIEGEDGLGHIGRILLQRLEWTRSVKITIRCAVLIVLLSNGLPGNTVLWAWTLRAIWLKNGRRTVDLHTWLRHFPLVLPSEEEISRVWEAQKDGKSPNGNRLDNHQVWVVPPDANPANPL